MVGTPDSTPRSRHLAGCKQQALQLVEDGRYEDAILAMGECLERRADTAGNPGVRLCVEMWNNGLIEDEAHLIKLIQDFE